MDDEIQLISDGDGLAVLGCPTAVERFLVSEGLPSKDLGLRRLRSVVGDVAAAARAGSDMAAASGRWVKLTKETAQRIDAYGLRKSGASGLSTGVLRGEKGRIKGFVEFAQGPAGKLGNPARLAGVATVMAQLAMQQAMDEVTEYLAAIDAKVDDVLRAQQDAALAGMIGVDLVIEEAMTVREQVGRVSEITWSKVQGASATIAATQAYAVRRLDALAARVESGTKVGDLARASGEAEARAQEWLAVLARCFQLQDAIAVIELDRVLDAAPEELERHRLGLRTARQNRQELIARCTERLIACMTEAAGTANAKVLLHPNASRDVVHASNHVEGNVVEFQGRLGIERGRQTLEARRWGEAAAEVRDLVLVKGAEGVDAARRFRNGTLDRARTATGRLSNGIAERARRGPGKNEEG